MKKLLALALTALMMVCAIIPAFADDATAELPEGFEDAEVVNFYDQWEIANDFSWSGTTCWPWGSNDFLVDGQFEALGKDTILLADETFVYNIVFTPDEDAEYSFALYLVNQTTQNGANTPLDSALASAFTLTLKKDDAVVATYTITEVQPAEVGSRLYYHFADNVALEADTDYTLSVQMVEKTQTCLVDFLFIPTADLTGGSDDAGEDTSADAGEDTSADAGEDTSADAGEDTSASAGDDNTAPETFDVALIALAVAGASAAAAVVSKKRR